MAPQSRSSSFEKFYQSKTIKSGPSLDLIQQDSELWYRIRVLLYDLRHFKDRDDSRDRLEQIIDPCYLGSPYFSHKEVKLLKSSIVRNKRSEDKSEKTLQQLIETTLDAKLNRRMKKRVESQDFRVCAAHDLAPILEDAFGVKPKELRKDKKFVKTLSLDILNFKSPSPTSKP